MVTVALPTLIADTTSTAGSLVAGRHNPVNANAKTLAMTLPTGATHGGVVSVEKVDASTNVVTITGSIRGIANSTITLYWQYESIGFRADATGSWWPQFGHKTKSSLDAAYAPKPLGIAAAGKYVDGGTNTWTPLPTGSSSSSTGTGSAGTVSVKDYGATGVESQDATSAIKNAIAAAVAKYNGNGVVYFPGGIYIINEGLVIPRGIVLRGEHEFNTQLRLYTQINSTPMLTFGSSGQIATGCGVQDMVVDAETNAQVAIRMYGPQEGSYLRRILAQNATVHTVEIIATNIEGGTNKFKIEDCWIWCSGDTGMAGIYFTGTAGPLAIRDTTLVGVNRSSTYANNNGKNGGGPSGSAGIISADGGIIVMDDVNVEHFESYINANSTSLDIRGASSFFCTNGVTVNTTNTPTVIVNATFDATTGPQYQNTNTGKTVSYLRSYRTEAYQYDRRTLEDNQWTLGQRGFTTTAGYETQVGYATNATSDLTRFKITTIQPGQGWLETANVDTTSTFGTAGSAWNGQHFRIGAFHLWVDGSNNLRVKSGAPTSDTDGTALGSGSGSSSVSDASATSKGIIQLAGDLAGTAAAPTVPALTTKANLASPTFTGTPSAPTPALNTSTTQIATAAMVTSAMNTAQASLVGINAQTAAYTIIAADAGRLLTYNSSSAGTFTLPTNSSVALNVGTVINFALLGSGALTVAGASGVTINSPAGFRVTTQYAQASVVKIATDAWLMSGQTVS